MLSSAGKGRRALAILLMPLLALWIILAFIWGGAQGVAALMDKLESWL